jgi:thiamine kinase-like enzyme
MWLQCKVPGQVASQLLASADGVALARRIAEAAHKLHQAGVPTTKHHTIADELRILEECLVRVGQGEPRLNRRLESVLEACQRLAANSPSLPACGSHRDFYADQVIVSAPQLYLIDFDLYCHADPGLDIGNFLGHVTEQSLREYGDPESLRDVEQAMEERYIELAGEKVRPAVRTYALLTLARHIYLSTRCPERRRWTESLLDLCEQRLDIAACGDICSLR